MAYPLYVREKARQLRRKEQLTIDQLAERLALPRTTIYYWVRDLPIPRSGPGGGFGEQARRKGNRRMQANYRRIREQAYELGYWEFPRLASDPTFRDFVCLYIAEGYKRSRNTVSIANSDPGSSSSQTVGCAVSRGDLLTTAFNTTRTRGLTTWHRFGVISFRSHQPKSGFSASRIAANPNFASGGARTAC
jgi:hypothetical protein